jgi:hypothetical protein
MASRQYSASSSKKGDQAMSLYIPALAILRRIPTSAPASLPSSPASGAAPASYTASFSATFTWDRWGHGGALLTKRFDNQRRLPMLSRVCGLRLVARHPIVRNDGTMVFRVMDFHPRRAAAPRASNNNNNNDPQQQQQQQEAKTTLSTISAGARRPIHSVIEVPLPEEVLRNVDPKQISTSICQDALIIFEVLFVSFRFGVFCFFGSFASGHFC